MRTTNAFLMACVLALLGACDTIDKWISPAEPPPLPGTRISVLLKQHELEADPGLEQKEIVLPRPSANPDWPQPGGYPSHAMHHIKVGDVLSRAWRTDIGTGSDEETRLMSSPIVADGKVFAMDAETTVSALDAKDGRELWSTELTPDDEDDGLMGGGIAYAGGRVFATTGFAQVIALDAKTGAILWRRSVGGPLHTAPTVVGGRVFAVTVDNKLHVLDAAKGTPLWTHSGITETASILGGGSPAVDQGVVVVPYSSGELVALKVENGRLLWSDSLTASRRTDAVSTLSHIRGRPVIDRGMVLAISHGGLLAAIDLRSGRRLWDREIGGLESPWIAGEYVFVLTNSDELVALDRKDGRIHWVQALPRYEDPEDKEDPILWTGPILVSDRLIVASSDGNVVSVSPYNGSFLGKEELPDGVTVPPVAARGTVYFLTDGADVIAYR